MNATSTSNIQNSFQNTNHYYYTFRDLNSEILKGKFGELWLFDKTPGNNCFKIYTEDRSLIKKISSWKSCKKSAAYYFRNSLIAVDIIIPKKLIKRTCRLLGISLKKDLRKIEAGNELSAKFKDRFYVANFSKNRRGGA